MKKRRITIGILYLICTVLNVCTYIVNRMPIYLGLTFVWFGLAVYYFKRAFDEKEDKTHE